MFELSILLWILLIDISYYEHKSFIISSSGKVSYSSYLYTMLKHAIICLLNDHIS